RRPAGIDSRGQVDVLDFQRVLVVVLLLVRQGNQGLLTLADDERRILRAEEARAVSRRAEEAVRRDADEVGQLSAFLLEFLGEQRAERRVMHRAAWEVPGAHLVGRPAVV